MRAARCLKTCSLINSTGHTWQFPKEKQSIWYWRRTWAAICLLFSGSQTTGISFSGCWREQQAGQQAANLCMWLALHVLTLWTSFGYVKKVGQPFLNIFNHIFLSHSFFFFFFWKHTWYFSPEIVCGKGKNQECSNLYIAATKSFLKAPIRDKAAWVLFKSTALV